MPINSFTGEYRFLSNFEPCQVALDGVTYPSVEHAYQAAKTLNMDERAQFVGITAGQAKRLGRKVTMREDWHQVKRSLMFSLVEQKFNNPALRRALVRTMPEMLIEGNTWHDNYWGDCSCSSCTEKEGENVLGKILMEIRLRSYHLEFTHISNLLYEARSIGFVGSRACTPEQLKRLGMVAGWAAVTDRLGVSGGCEGADQTAANKFVEYGKQANFHVHMPWPQYNTKHMVPDGCTWDCWDDKYNKAPGFVIPSDLREDALWLAMQHDRARTTRYPNLMGRNALIVMGSGLLVYAINGDSAGTTHDINIANDLRTPTLNVSDDVVWENIYAFLKMEREELNRLNDNERWDGIQR